MSVCIFGNSTPTEDSSFMLSLCGSVHTRLGSNFNCRPARVEKTSEIVLRFSCRSSRFAKACTGSQHFAGAKDDRMLMLEHTSQVMPVSASFSFVVRGQVFTARLTKQSVSALQVRKLASQKINCSQGSAAFSDFLHSHAACSYIVTLSNSLRNL